VYIKNLLNNNQNNVSQKRETKIENTEKHRKLMNLNLVSARLWDF